MSKFSSMLSGPYVAPGSRPVEDFVADLIASVKSTANKLGYVSAPRVTAPAYDPCTAASICIITFNLQKGTDTTNAVIQVRYHSNSILPGGGARVHSAQGFPEELRLALLNISPSAFGKEDAKGVQADQQDYPSEDEGCGEVEAGPDSQSGQTSNQVAAAIVTSIDLATIRKHLAIGEKPRRYIGASGIGESCMAYHALSMRGFPSDAPSPQLLRIFEAGHMTEEIVVAALKGAGHTVEEKDPTTGKQWAYVSHGGHHRAHLDGFITLLGGGERMTLEIKSMNRDMFDSFKRRGVALSHPEYFAQCQDGLRLAVINGVDVSRCLLVAYCKDNSQYHTEIIEHDRMASTVLMSKVDSAVYAGANIREGDSKHTYKCKECFKRTSCWEPNVQERDCSHCAFSKPMKTVLDLRRWLCEISNSEATATCSSFKLFRPTGRGGKP